MIVSFVEGRKSHKWRDTWAQSGCSLGEQRKATSRVLSSAPLVLTLFLLSKPLGCTLMTREFVYDFDAFVSYFYFF